MDDPDDDFEFDREPSSTQNLPGALRSHATGQDATKSNRCKEVQATYPVAYESGGDRYERTHRIETYMTIFVPLQPRLVLTSGGQIGE